MAISNIEIETILSTDLRDSDGNHLKIVSMVQFDGTYDTGGIALNPEWFEMEEIKLVITQSGSALPLDVGEPWNPITFNIVQRVDDGIAANEAESGTFSWRLNVALWDGSSFAELSDGSPLQLPTGFSPVLVVVGA